MPRPVARHGCRERLQGTTGTHGRNARPERAVGSGWVTIAAHGGAQSRARPHNDSWSASRGGGQRIGPSTGLRGRAARSRQLRDSRGVRPQREAPTSRGAVPGRLRSTDPSFRPAREVRPGSRPARSRPARSRSALFVLGAVCALRRDAARLVGGRRRPAGSSSGAGALDVREGRHHHVALGHQASGA